MHCQFATESFRGKFTVGACHSGTDNGNINIVFSQNPLYIEEGREVIDVQEGFRISWILKGNDENIHFVSGFHLPFDLLPVVERFYLACSFLANAFNPGGRIKLGAVLSVDIVTRQSSRGPVLPASAVIDEDGKPVVYIQVEGESFERRAVRLGTREGDRLRVLEGVRAGERVAAEGAYLIRLAAASSRVPEHGHAH